MDQLATEYALNEVLCRAGDFVGGIDNEALDFSQLEAFINSDGSQSNGNYFGESLNNAQSTGKLLNVIVENKRVPGHSLPESPPDSSSEHPYSPPENCEAPLGPSEAIYTTLGQAIYKPNLINPILTDGGIILGSHIVVADPNIPNGQLLENTNLLHADLSANPVLLDTRLAQDATYTEVQRRGPNELLLVKTPGAPEYDKSLVHMGFTPMDTTARVVESGVQICDSNLDGMVYTNLQNAPKKRKLSQDMIVKSEPSEFATTPPEANFANTFITEHCSPSQLSPPENMGGGSVLDEDYPPSESCLSDSQYQCIRFQPFQQPAWHALVDQNLTELASPHYRVDADKGFNFSNADDAFVCQKKNHFQVTCHVQLLGDAQFVKTTDGFQKISSFHLHFYGVKHDCPTQTIRVEQSQSDRSKKPFHPVLVDLQNAQVTKVTVGRLHFSETTSNNMRKKGKPNPEQRYFQLVVGLHAHTSHGNFPIISHASQKIIVRASNPGQFESDVELCWQKGQTQDSIFHSGKVGVNTDRPDESLVVHGNLKITGHIIQPSDIRAKKNIVECDTAEQLRNVQKLRVVKYEYEPGFATQLNRSPEYSDTGVIAQEVAKILPEAVSPAGNLILENGTSIDNFLVVNKERIFMENLGAVKELCKVTDNLETRIGQLEKMNKRLVKIKKGDSINSNSTLNSSKYSKCTKFHDCSNEADGDDELCSNTFMQVLIVLLVLVMAICLAIITALYFMETKRHRELTQASLQAVYNRAMTTNRPTKGPNKTGQTAWPNLQQLQMTTPYRDSGLHKNTLGGLFKTGTLVIGRPSDCSIIYEDLDSQNLCQIFCCATPKLDTNGDIETSLFSDSQHSSHPHNKTADLLNIDKNKIVKAFHSNNIDKQRQKRDNLYFPDRDNNYDAIDDLHFNILIQGKKFNTTLTDTYLTQQNGLHNFSFAIPISKYMPDEYINLIFQSSHAHLKDIEHCHNNHRQHECPFISNFNYEENKTQIIHKVNENSPSQQINSHSVTFEVDMVGFQSKIMTYRASLKQNQNKCKLSPTKLGIEFTEYNFHLYRYCDE